MNKAMSKLSFDLKLQALAMVANRAKEDVEGMISAMDEHIQKWENIVNSHDFSEEVRHDAYTEVAKTKFHRKQIQARLDAFLNDLAVQTTALVMESLKNK